MNAELAKRYGSENMKVVISRGIVMIYSHCKKIRRRLGQTVYHFGTGK
jgi:hypothetical protein